MLNGYNLAPDAQSSAAAKTFMQIGYSNFLSEVNNLNKRMGELRDTQGEAGVWARILNGEGSGDGGYSDRYTLFQMGPAASMS